VEIIIIAAVAQNNVIGYQGEMPWHSREEFKHFKNTTMGSPMIMGRKTFESIGKPLPGRKSIVISRNEEYNPHPEVVSFNSLEKAIEFCEKSSFEKVFIIGGANVYEQFFPLADKLIISEMKLTPDGDSFFPIINHDEWENYKSELHDEFEVKYFFRIKK